MEELAIIVPIAVQALVVPADEQLTKLDLSTNLDGTTIFGEEMQVNLSELINGSRNSYCQKGIHLHWKLPKLLKHGIVNDKGDLEFPSVPNRWMIVRYHSSTIDPKSIPCKIWVLKSDVILGDNSEKPNNWVVLENGTFDFNSVGSVQALKNNYEEQEENAVDLTAVGAANPYFSAIYDECKDVFGFCDEATDLKNNDVINYLVIGWYSSPKDDPFNPNTNVDLTIVEKIKRQWIYSECDKTPTSSLFHSTLYQVIWDEKVKNGYSSADIGVAFGNTTTEALSALLSKTLSVSVSDKFAKNLELSLNALQYQLLEDESKLPTQHSLLLENHKRQFVPKQSGYLWEIKKNEEQSEFGLTDKKPHFPQDHSLLLELKKLNSEQETYNNLRESLKSTQREYYFSWYKKARIKKNPISVPFFSNAEQFLDLNNGLDKELNYLVGKINTLKSELITSKKALEFYIKSIENYTTVRTPLNKSKIADYELVQCLQDRFWEPTDPTILFYGDGLGDVNDYFQDVSDLVKCRLSSEIHTHLTIASKTIKANDVFQLQQADIENRMKLLVDEALLLDEKLVPYIAQHLEGTTRGSLSKTTDLIKNTLVPLQNNTIAALEKWEFRKYKQSWEPTFLLWEIGYCSVKDGKEITCNGFTPLSNGVIKNFALSTEGLQTGQLSNCLGQSLSGLNKQLLAQVPSLQLPPLKYNITRGVFSTNLDLDNEVVELLGNDSTAYNVAINPEQQLFSPLRNGAMIIKKLSLVDAFGQEKIIIDKNNTSEIILAQSFGKSIISASDKIPLEARIIQPMQLKFNWVNQYNEKLYQDTGKFDHPFIGWLVPNFLDKTILVYNHLGLEVKAVRLNENGIASIFYPLKDGSLTDAEIRAEREKSMLPELKAVLENCDFNFVLEQANTLKQKLARSNRILLDDSMVSLLYGKPIAIAKASLSLNLLGDAERNPSWEKSLEIDTGSIETHNIQLKIGDKTQTDDGLLGYYLNHNYSKLYQNELLKISPNGENQQLILLLTAGSGFYINSSGYLPTKYVELMPLATDECIRDIAVSYLLCPFIADKNSPQIPLAEAQNEQWYWLHKSGINTWMNPEKIRVNNQEEYIGTASKNLYEGWIRMETTQHDKSN